LPAATKTLANAAHSPQALPFAEANGKAPHSLANSLSQTFVNGRRENF